MTTSLALAMNSPVHVSVLLMSVRGLVFVFFFCNCVFVREYVPRHLSVEFKLFINLSSFFSLQIMHFLKFIGFYVLVLLL